MHAHSKIQRRFSTFITSLLMVNVAAALPVSLGTLPSSGYNQNFDSLATAGSAHPWVDESTLPGWALFNASGTALGTYSAGTGSSATGGFYSYGSVSSSDRALGGLGSGAYFGSPAAGAIAGWIAVSFANDLGSTVVGLDIGWNGEQWRTGGNSTPQSMVFEYGFGDAFASVASWTAPGGDFDWTSPVATTTSAAVDGNAAGLVADRGGQLNQLAWAPGQTLWLRWLERNDAGNDHGLAVDDFSLAWRLLTVEPDPGPSNGVPDAGGALGLFVFSIAGLCLVTRRSARTCRASG